MGHCKILSSKRSVCFLIMRTFVRMSMKGKLVSHGILMKYVAKPQSLFLFLEFNIILVDGQELIEDGMQHLPKKPASSA
eukprot:5702490-Amphidinium_carterae.1